MCLMGHAKVEYAYAPPSPLQPEVTRLDVSMNQPSSVSAAASPSAIPARFEGPP